MSRRRAVTFILATLIVLHTGRASAQATGQQTGPASVAVVAPRLVSSATIAYPEGAAGDAVIVLTLTVNADGSVRSAQAIDGAEPFASAAAEAARAWRFEPATREGHPVAAVIHFQVAFVAPVQTAAPNAAPEKVRASEPPPNAVPPAPKPRVLTPIEVEVRGEKLAPGVSSFARTEVRQLPGAFGDPFRAVEALPGVTPIVSGLPFFYVRGAPPGNVGYFLDGVRIPYLYHAAVGPSVVHPGLIDRVDLYPGGYPARFGRFAGGVVSGETTEPRPDFHGEGNIRLFDAGALAETGFAGGRGTVLLGGRYSYTAALVSLFAPNIDLAYRDYQARVSYDVTPHDRLTLFSFGSYDLLGTKSNDILTVLFGSEFYRLDLRYDHSFGRASTVRTSITLGYDQTRVGEQRNATDKMLQFRTELHHAVSDTIQVRAGVDALLDGFGSDPARYGDPDNPATIAFDNEFPPRTDLALGAFADVVLDITPYLEVTPGVRADFFSSATPPLSRTPSRPTAYAVDPRLAARFKLSDDVRTVYTFGLAHQPASFLVPIPGLVPGGLGGGLQTSVQTSAGVEVDLPEATTATATFFHNAFFNMSDALGVTRSGDPTENLNDQRSTGSGIGFELFIHRRLTKQLGGFISYTLSRSSRTVPITDLFNRTVSYTFPSAFDRTHVLNAAIAYDFGRGVRFGIRHVFYTGVPAAPPPSVSSSTSSRPNSATALSLDRTPAFYRLDLRLEKRWSLKRSRWISFVMEFMNTTLNKETLGNTRIGPVALPSIGLEAGF